MFVPDAAEVTEDTKSLCFADSVEPQILNIFRFYPSISGVQGTAILMIAGNGI